MAEPRVKRLKISRDEDDYRPGNITEIELHNFMTFSDLKCKPGSRLNLVIGPNGSGKSSLVCAIALGLGGEPQLLGRASSVGAYVKRGEESGYVKISLKGYIKEEQLIIMRRIDTRNKSEWLFNGKVVSKKEVLETIQKFNIQVNNLTQFLPQDRVCEFAKLSPLQLLEETEKAIGDPQLPVQHSALVEKSKNLKKLEQTVKQISESLNQQKALNAEQEKDVKRVRQRQKLLEKAELMKKKLPWLKYDMKKAGYMETKEKEVNAKKKLDEAAKNLNDLREPIEKQKIEKALQDTKSKKVMNLINQNVSKRLELIESENSWGVQVQGKYREMEDLKRQEKDYKQRLLKAKEDLAAAEQELVNLPFYEPPKEKIESLGAQILELQISVNQKMLQKSEREKLLVQKRVSLRQCMDRLKDMENTHNKLLNALRNSGADRIYEAYNWLKEHRHELNKEVYGPVLIEVNVSNRSHANYLEGHVPYYAWKSFITQDPRDRDILVKNLKSFDVPVLNYVGSDGHHKAPFQVSEEMRLLGIQSRLDQVFNAPSAVKEVLVGQFGLDHSYVGSKEADHRANEVSKLGIMDFWTPENHYRWSTSRYGGHISGSVDSVSNSHLLMCSSDVGEIEMLRSKKNELDESINGLEESFKSIQTDQRHLDDEMANLHKEREEIINTVQFEKKKRKELENRVNLRKKRLQSIEHEDNIDTTMARLIDQAAKYNGQRFQCAIKIKKLLIENVAHRHSFAEKHMSSIEFDAKIREMESNLKQHEKLALQISMDFENCKKDVEDYKRLLLAAKRHAESIAMITPELEKVFLEMPATIEELEAAIQDVTTQANSILFLNQNILEEYEQRQRKIQALTTSLEANENELRSCLAETDALKESWLPKLRDLVAQINETFSRNFQDMAVAGEVSLDEHGMDFGDYGILIKVKFRQAGQLQVLSAHHQSGGERSVSTILYLVSLQDLTNCPFRVVDEINQGMDPINERKMFQQLVRAASQLNTPQCFLLTPKLLPDLEYSEACSILNIMNGPWIKQPSKVWSNGDSFGTILGLVDKNQC